jgi:indolepyruvate ferredoxin oxidoreductase beta subunit
METKNIMIVGVGGQGSLLASKLLGHLLLTQGYDVKVSEVHGMSQRGGSVVTYVRFGDKVYSPVIDRGEADIIVSFELLEAARYLPYLKEGGRIVTNTQRIDPMPVVTGAAEYPENILENLSKDRTVYSIDAMAEAKKLGNQRVFNLVVLGMAAKHMDFTAEQWNKIIEKTVPPKTVDINLKAFERGYAA